MPSRERFVRAATRAAEIATTRRVRVVVQLLLLAALAFGVLRLRSTWEKTTIKLDTVDWDALVGALVVAGAGVVATGFVWLLILNRLGIRTRPRWTAIFFQAQVAKYIPGSVWQYAGRVALARGRGLPIRPVAISMPIEVGASLAGGAIVAALLLGWWAVPIGAAAVAACVAVARSSGSREESEERKINAVATAIPLYAAVLTLIGAGFWLTARALVAVPADRFVYYVGAYAAAWAVGLVAVYAPGGIGVREAVLVALLHPPLGSGDALVVAFASRAVMTAIDIFLAGLGFLLLRGRNGAFAAPEATLPRGAADPSETIGP